MHISEALAADLASLTDALDAPGTDLEALLSGLCSRMRLAVPSCTGLSMTMVVDGCPLTLDAMSGVADVGSSMLLPLSPLGTAEPGSVVVFYAANPGAFVDLAADVDFAVGDGHHPVVLDENLWPPTATSGVNGLDVFSAVNKAVGILIGDGRSPEAADAELDRRAREAGVTRHTAALRVLPAPG